jgi:hypothetical protein
VVSVPAVRSAVDKERQRRSEGRDSHQCINGQLSQLIPSKPPPPLNWVWTTRQPPPKPWSQGEPK